MEKNLQHGLKRIFLAGGCFWGVERYMQGIAGVVHTQTGYANGISPKPTYEDVCNGSGHAEVVCVAYDPALVTLSSLLERFYEIIDPTTKNRQGNGAGVQYRTGVYFIDSEEEGIVAESLERLQKKYGGTVVVEAGPLYNYIQAEEYHQNYLIKNPDGYCHISKDKLHISAGELVDSTRYSRPEEETLKRTLNKLQYEVTQNSETEPPFQNEYWDLGELGVYVDITTGEPLFLSVDKFNSGCGWPSFSKPVDAQVVRVTGDSSHGMRRMEVRSRVGNAHLGHVFSDGPRDSGGLRYCMNSAAMRFIPLEKMRTLGYGFLIPLLEPPKG